MKKYSFLVYHKQYVDFLEKLREIGVLHVKELTEGIAENDALRRKMHLAARIQTVIKQLESIIPENIDENVEVIDEESGINLLYAYRKT